MTSSSQNEEFHINYSTPTSKDPPESKNTAVIAVMRGKPKDVYHCHHSNKHYKWTLVRVLLDTGSDGNLVFVGQTHAASLLKKAGSTVVEYFEWDHPDLA